MIGAPRWAADGGNGRVVPMTEPEMTPERRNDLYWVCEAIRAWSEGDRLRGNKYLGYAYQEMKWWEEKQEQGL